MPTCIWKMQLCFGFLQHCDLFRFGKCAVMKNTFCFWRKWAEKENIQVVRAEVIHSCSSFFPAVCPFMLFQRSNLITYHLCILQPVSVPLLLQWWFIVIRQFCCNHSLCRSVRLSITQFNVFWIILKYNCNMWFKIRSQLRDSQNIKMTRPLVD